MTEKSRRKKSLTKRFAHSFFLLIALSVLHPAGPASAQEHFVLDSFVGAGAYFTDNVFFRESEKESDIYFVLQPGANLAIPLYSRNFTMGLGYKLGVYYFTSNGDLSQFLHNFDIAVGFGKEFTRRPGFLRDLKVTINDEVDSITRVLRFGEKDPLNMVQRNRFILRPIYEHSFTRKLKLVGEYQFQRVDYFDSNTNSFMGNDLSGAVRRIMNQYVTLYGALEMMQRLFDSPEEYTNVGDYIGFQMRIGADLTWRRLTGGIFGGYAMYMVSGEADLYGPENKDTGIADLLHTVKAEEQSGPIFLLEANYLLTRMIELNLMFNRYYRIDVAGELVPSMGGRFQGIFKFSKNFIINANASYQMYENIQSIPVYIAEGEIDTDDPEGSYIKWIEDNLGEITLLSFGLGASYEFYRGLSIKLDFSYQSQEGGGVETGEPYSRMVGGVMVRYDFKTIRFIL